MIYVYRNPQQVIDDLYRLALEARAKIKDNTKAQVRASLQSEAYGYEQAAHVLESTAITFQPNDESMLDTKNAVRFAHMKSASEEVI